MPFTLTAGEFVPEAGRPDGDSIRFRPDNPTPLFQLPRRSSAPRINSKNGTIQLRFEGIDTMESRALSPFSEDATSSNLELCGVPNGMGTARGNILSTQIGPNGRPICFVYLGDATETDGDDAIFVDVDRMKKSVNYQQLSKGYAYPLFYDTLYFDLRIAMADEAASARARGENVWSADVTHTGAFYTGRQSLGTLQPLFPKLWRRLDSYSRSSDIANPDTMDEFMA